MAGEKTTVKFDASSLDAFGDKFKKSIEKSLNNLDSSGLQKKMAEAFSMKGLKEGLAGSFKEGLAGTEKVKSTQAAMSQILMKNSALSKSFSSAISSGAGSGKVLSAGLKLAQNYGAGMLKNINPYVAALKVGVELTKQFLKYYQKTLETSKKFVTSGSLFTDKATMDMMQRTGQSAAGAQGTNRALDRLGISFEEIQTGKVSKKQMEAFEELRKSETARLEDIQRIGGPVFESMQHAALAVATAKQKFDDAITMAFAKSKGVLIFAKNLQGMAETIGDLVYSMASFIAPIVSLVGGLLGSIMGVIKMVANVLKVLMNALTPVFDTIGEIVGLVMTTVGKLVSMIGRIVGAIMKPIGKIISIVSERILAPIQLALQYVSALVDAVFSILEPIIQYVELIMDIFTSMMPMKDSLEQLQPIMDIVVTYIKIMGAAIGWVISKWTEGIKWAWDKTTTGITDFVNMITEAWTGLINKLVDVVNILLPKGMELDRVSSGSFDMAAMLSGLQGGMDGVLASIQGDTFNYNNTTNETVTPNANANLFANMYTIVND